MKTRLLIIIPIVIASVILGIIAYDSVSLDKMCVDDHQFFFLRTCFIPIITNSTKDTQIVDMSLIKTMKPNSMEWFYYPNTKNHEKADAYQTFLLIRLPESLGGDADDVSAFRAYSAVSLADHCLIKYWPQEGRQRIEGPCWGDMYRAIDGLAISNLGTMVTSPTALPNLVLSADENGFLYVEPPTWTLDENGVIGVGRTISFEEIRQGSAILVNMYKKSHPLFPQIPIDFAGHILSDIRTEGNRVAVRYFDFTSGHDFVSLDVGLATAYDQQSLLDFTKPDSEFWQIGDTVIKIGGSAFDKNNKQPDEYKSYEIQFIRDEYNFRFEGKNLEFMKQEVVKNYFPEYKYDDMLLISKTTE